MRRALSTLVLTLPLVAACHRPVPPEVLRDYQSRTLFTCCNLHYESDKITDANYFVGTLLPFGTPVTIEKMTNDSVTFSANGVKLTLYHSYGTEQESSMQYFDKVLVPTDPKASVSSFSPAAQEAIREGRVERGMTREQVLVSLGYPATHQTPSIAAPEWTYWYSRFVTYKVVFDDAGRVSQIIGRPAPTRDEPVP